VALATTPQDKTLNQGLKQIADSIIRLEPQTSNGVEFFKTQGT